MGVLHDLEGRWRLALGSAVDAQMADTEGRLTLTFTLPLPEPLDPRGVDVAFSIFDPTFYIEILPAKENPVRLVGPAPETCQAAVRPFLGADGERFIPDSLALSFYTDPNDPENGLGARFAEWIDVTCEHPG